MSFNIRYGTAPDGEHSWECRKQLVIQRIRLFDPDILGLQECRDDDQAEFIRKSLSDYEFVGVQRGGCSDSAIEMSPILFKRDLFQELERGHSWLSETPDAPGSVSWNGLLPRTAIWVKLRRKKTNETLVFLNTHFDHRSKTAIDKSSKLLLQWARGIEPQHGLIITGDFNIAKNSTAYEMLAERRVLRDVYRDQHAIGDEVTFHGYGKTTMPSSIDWILASPHLRTIDAQVDRYVEHGLYLQITIR
jgi:endonuclease/exonuclease/phosphatase family metal-dependent hydrolase